ncbi:hypothetical protein BL250_12450 [Erwinia sp. OLTSP20]|nr:MULTISPECIES: EexN family lipoprotein [Enterobacterales]PIJ69757.1 hypothetical protein BK416_13890 [Erwinia sp. OLSSP12]PIJ89367.1 hypothetical protein BL249_16635 [Erwinia sp. OLFS4]PII85136.1 hypothetical protein BMF91_23965 [Serratia sp. OLFL2]PIJ49362.1 hypothetical protein BV501_13060 [Erwinia sp. OAMSP11]PIJ76241.1 hypothetical protein BLD47_18145 [Erwinia sp. OLCASP19]
MKKLIVSALVAMSLCACGEKVYDADYYQANHEKAEEAIKKCNAGEMTGENCNNAKTGLDKYKAKAFEDYMLGKTKKRPSAN